MRRTKENLISWGITDDKNCECGYKHQAICLSVYWCLVNVKWNMKDLIELTGITDENHWKMGTEIIVIC